MKTSYFGLLRRLLAPAPTVPAPRCDLPPMRVHRFGAVLSQGGDR